MNIKTPELITCEAAAKILQIHPSSVPRLIKAGVLRGTKHFGRHWKIDAEDIRKMIARELTRDSGRSSAA